MKTSRDLPTRSSYVASNGYRRIQLGKGHPLADGNGEMYQHRYVMAVLLGRPLRSDEHVHHIDGDKLNNHPSNLEIVTHRVHRAERHGNRLVTDRELRELILVCGYGFPELQARGIKNTHRIQNMRHALKAEGHDLSYRVCPNGHRYPPSDRPRGRGRTRCSQCRAEAYERRERRVAA